ncbi:hypothetical protein BN1708_010725 [Verticillium longisporum]|uniref:Heterokaryon incompatibility domain-containing protein n=1 Tax=Verticillium longisporum TaxID=100787 RepID=A0A0G4KUD8_VERLO|nr:hypothetical protein BN1708_010725 [Verticillium longisporum]
MRAVVKLGFRYVWIDRYCIWQDDQIHKMSQVERMDQIYSDAELTIVAVGAKDPGYGLPGLTLSRTQHVPINKRIGERHLVGKFSHHWQLNEVSKSKWATRGWTFQETCLSRRRLYFSNYEVSFECHDMMCFEHLTQPHAYEGSLEHRERPEWNQINNPHGIWAVISNYCERQLSSSSDRLAAITGVLNRWAKVNQGCASYWGIPVVASGTEPLSGASSKQAFLAGLHWQLQARTGKAGLARLSEFPSWSWVSQNGRCLFGHPYYHIIPPNLEDVSKEFDAEVWIETPDGKAVEWSVFRDGSGLERSSLKWSRYIHLECWSFQTGSFYLQELRHTPGSRSPVTILYVPVTNRPNDADEKTTIIARLLPDSGFGNLSRLKRRDLTAVTFSPVEHSAFALVLDIVAGDTLRVGILELAKLIDRDTFESAEAFRGHLDPAQFAATRRRVRLG